jgi:hypothetical protein
LNELTVIENTYVSKKEEVTGILKQFCKEKFRDLHSSLTVVMVVKSRKMRWTEHVTRMAENRNAWRDLVQKIRRKETTFKT